MRELGRAFGQQANAGDRFLLEGPFGAGKTTFVQGLARGLAVAQPVGSPSFVIETRYQGRLTLYHIDLYRVDQLDAELRESLEEHLFGESVSAVEWAERLPRELRAGATLLQFKVNGETRQVEVSQL
jgi:tRNA threonylcarbamoyladenosine biosynthesis protein TsaE